MVPPSVPPNKEFILPIELIVLAKKMEKLIQLLRKFPKPVTDLSNGFSVIGHHFIDVELSVVSPSVAIPAHPG
jgi:hypothetical protein